MLNNNSHRKNSSGYPEPLSSLVPKIMASLGLSKKYFGWQIVAEWDKIVGENIARISKAIKFDNGILTVAVESDSWRQELSLQRSEIITKIHNHPSGKVVKQLQFVRGAKG